MADRVRKLIVAAVVLGVGSLVAFEEGDQQRSAQEWTNMLAGEQSAEIAMQSWTVTGWVLVGVAALLLLAGLIGWVTRRD